MSLGFNICSEWNSLAILSVLVHQRGRSSLTFGRDDQTSAFSGTTVDSLDDINQLERPSERMR
jgi:hypothetical protein